jgi:hypothetical protein
MILNGVENSRFFSALPSMPSGHPRDPTM